MILERYYKKQSDFVRVVKSIIKSASFEDLHTGDFFQTFVINLERTDGKMIISLLELLEKNKKIDFLHFVGKTVLIERLLNNYDINDKPEVKSWLESKKYNMNLENRLTLLELVDFIKNIKEKYVACSEVEEIIDFIKVPYSIAEYDGKKPYTVIDIFENLNTVNENQQGKYIHSPIVDKMMLDVIEFLESKNIFSLSEYKNNSTKPMGYRLKSISNAVAVKIKEFDTPTEENINSILKSSLITNRVNKYKLPIDVSILSDIKKTFFKKVNGVKWNEVLVVLEDKGVIFIKRTPSLRVKEIVISNETLRKDIIDNPFKKVLLDLEREGKIKKDNWEGEVYYLYKLNVFPHLKVNLRVIDNNLHFSINYFSLRYARSIMEDLGNWQDFKNKLKLKFSERICKIDGSAEFLSHPITIS